MPDRTVLLRLDTETAVERARDRCDSPISDRFEAEGDDFQDRIAAAFDRIAAAEPERFIVVDAAGSVDEVHARVLEVGGADGASRGQRRGRRRRERAPRGVAQATAEQPACGASPRRSRRPRPRYLVRRPAGSGKAAAARAFAAEILAIGASDPDDARRRALADPSPHPDLTWLVPPATSTSSRTSASG